MVSIRLDLRSLLQQTLQCLLGRDVAAFGTFAQRSQAGLFRTESGVDKVEDVAAAGVDISENGGEGFHIDPWCALDAPHRWFVPGIHGGRPRPPTTQGHTEKTDA